MFEWGIYMADVNVMQLQEMDEDLMLSFWIKINGLMWLMQTK